MFTPLYAKPGTSDYEDYHQIGFVVFGVYLTCISIGLACVSRYVIKLYNMFLLSLLSLSLSRSLSLSLSLSLLLPPPSSSFYFFVV